MPGATLTLGINTFTLIPPSGSGVTLLNPDPSTWEVSTNSTAVTPLVVKTETTPGKSSASHTVTFKTALSTVDVDTTPLDPSLGPDRGDRIIFEQTVGNATVKAGENTPTQFVVSGDTVAFQGGLGSGSFISTGTGRDSVLFASNAVDAYTGIAGRTLVNTGAGSDSIRFSSTTKVGPNVTLDFGTPGTTDLDILFGAARSTFQTAGIQVRNFTQGFDQVRVGSSTILKTQAEINTFFGDTGQSIRLI